MEKERETVTEQADAFGGQRETRILLLTSRSMSAPSSTGSEFEKKNLGLDCYSDSGLSTREWRVERKMLNSSAELKKRGEIKFTPSTMPLHLLHSAPGQSMPRNFLPVSLPDCSPCSRAGMAWQSMAATRCEAGRQQRQEERQRVMRQWICRDRQRRPPETSQDKTDSRLPK